MPASRGCWSILGSGWKAGRRLNPGAHLKWPWPIDHVYRFRTEQIQSFEIGIAPSAEEAKAESREKEPVVLWTVAHTKEQEDNFLVANRRTSSMEDTNEPAAKRTPPVSLIDRQHPCAVSNHEPD